MGDAPSKPPCSRVPIDNASGRRVYSFSGAGTGRRFPHRCSDSEKYGTTTGTCFTDVCLKDAPERALDVLESCVVPELERGEGLHPMVVGLEFPEVSPPHNCRALLAAVGEALAALARELWRLSAGEEPRDLGELLFTTSRMAPGSEPFGDTDFLANRLD